MVVGELRQYVPEGRDNIYQWRDRRDVSQQLGRVVIILNIDIYFKLILDQSRQSYHLGCMIVPVELHVHFGAIEVIVHYPGEKAGTDTRCRHVLRYPVRQRSPLSRSAYCRALLYLSYR